MNRQVLIRENQELREEVRDLKGALRRAEEEAGRFCQERDRYRAALADYANRANWSSIIGRDEENVWNWREETWGGHGYELAEKALGRPKTPDNPKE